MDEAEDAQAGAMPQLIVQVETTVANVQDVEMTPTIQEDFAQHPECTTIRKQASDAAGTAGA